MHLPRMAVRVQQLPAREGLLLFPLQGGLHPDNEGGLRQAASLVMVPGFPFLCYSSRSVHTSDFSLCDVLPLPSPLRAVTPFKGICCLTLV